MTTTAVPGAPALPTITAIVPSPRREGRWVVQVDGREAATLSIDAVERLGLRAGARVNERLQAAMEREHALTGALDRALNMLAFRARSVRDLRRRLVQKGEPEDVADAAIARLVELGLLDDAAFARQYARSKVLSAGHSRRRLQQELYRKGVAREVAEASIEEVMAEDGVDEEAIIERAARKKLRTLAGLDPDARRRRLYGYLARRGYELDDIRRVMDELLE
ncbi:MAG TPA: regulatory protein RecX [Gemmatimonadaceae bacterium]|nr:regulatory protein RecX [Gemmatimonadaceae bacterium]